MNVRLKWTIALITVGILCTVGGAIAKLIQSNGSNNLLLTGLAAHVSGLAIVMYDSVYSRKLD